MRLRLLSGRLARYGLMALLCAGLSAGAVDLSYAASAAAAPAAKAPTKPDTKSSDSKQSSASPFPTKSKDPIYITADRLDIFDKEGRAVYSGPSGVTVTQGPSKVVGSELTAYYERQRDQQPAAGGDAQAGTQPAPQQSGMAGSQIKRILIKGPVSVVQNDQVATGDGAEFDRVQNVVTLTGHVSLTQGPNVTTGDKLIYDLNSGIANVFSAPGTPVKSLFVQGSQSGDAKPGAPKPAKPAPKPAGKAGKPE